MLLFYIRHGDPIYSPDSLTALGHQQAEALKYRLAVGGLDQIYASTSTRAIMTAEPTANMLDLEITTLDWCHENHAWADFSVEVSPGQRRWVFGHRPILDLFNSSEIRRLDLEWYEHPEIRNTRMKEGYLRICRECDDFIAALGYRHDREAHAYIPEAPNDRRIALFAHEGFGKLFLSALLDIPYPLFSTRFELGHSSMTVISFENRRDEVVYPHVLQASNDSHIFSAGLPTKFQNHCLF